MSLYAKKSLGQNFLKSKKAIHTMINSVGTNSDSLIVEIGPGKGALTEPLLETGATVIAYELDERMIDFLKEKFSVAIDQEKLILRHADILEADITSDTNGKTYSVVANIPYYITGMIIRTLLSHEHPPEKMALLMQKEVAQRITKRDGKESILSLAVDFYADASYEMTVKKQYFSPQPKVDSAVLSLENIQTKNKDMRHLEKTYFTLVKQAFSQKRKKAINNLATLAPKTYWEKVFTKNNILVTERAENISSSIWLQLAETFVSDANNL